MKASAIHRTFQDAPGSDHETIMRNRQSLILAIAGLLLAMPLSAHHSTAANFNSESIISVTGTVTEYRFQNPHVQILLDVENDAGQIERWMVELAAKNQFIRRGWTGDEFQPGQVITAFGWEGYRPRSAYLTRAIMPDGSEIRPVRLVTDR